jgi:Ca2+-binding RTX toxin-like protein
MRIAFLLTGLVLLLVANIVMIYSMYSPVGQEGFASYFLENAGGAKDTYKAMGPFDNVRLSTGNDVSTWRYTAPNEPLMGPAFKVGDDSLFMFKNNQ